MKNTKNINITGMSCSACALRIEKKLNKLEGIKKAEVNLPLEKLKVEYDDNTNIDKIINTVESLGYGAKEDIKENDIEDTIKKQEELKRRKYELFVSIICTFPIFLNMILHMFGIDLQVISNQYVQFFLATIVQFVIGYRFYKNAFFALKSGSTNMDVLVSLGTTASYLYSVYMMIMTITTGDIKHLYFDSSTMIISLVLLGKYFESKSNFKTSNAIRELLKLKPSKALVIKEGKEEYIDIEKIMVSDIIIVKPGEKIPTDAIVIEGKSSIDESMITGESMPVSKNVNDNVIGGTINTNGTLKIKATSVGNDTVLSQIIFMVKEAQNSKAKIEKIVDKVSAIFVPSVMVISIVTFILWLVISNNFTLSFINAISVLVVSCPCALGLATPTAIMVATGKGAQNSILIKSGEFLEKIEKIDVVVFDKTGTLTKGKLTVSDIITLENITSEELLKIVAIAEKKSEHVIGRAIYEYVKEQSEYIKEPDKFEAIPGKGIFSMYNGSNILVGNRALMKDNNIDISHVNKKIEKIESQGKTTVIISKDSKCIGVISVADEIKESAYSTIKRLNSMNITPFVITGDNVLVAKYVANKLNIQNVYAEVLPKDKAKYIEDLKNRKQVVAMVGDGINDAPALTISDIGISMGNGTDIANEASDITIVNGNLNLVVEAIRLSKLTMKKIKQNLFWAFIYNVIGIVCAAFGFLNPIIAAGAMAFSSVSVVTNSLSLNKFKVEEEK